MSTKPKIRWTPSEQEKLRAIYSTTAWPELQAVFGRSLEAIQLKAQSLKLQRRFHREPNRRWTAEDDAVLREKYWKLPVREIAELLGRSVQCVPKRAQALDLVERRFITRETGPWQAAEDEFLKTSLCILPISEIVAHLNRAKTAIYKRMQELDLVGRQGRGMGRGGAKLPIGTERAFRGYLLRKVSSTGIQIRDWKRVEVIEWEAIHGPVPQGMVLVKQDRQPRTAENLKLKSISDIPYLSVFRTMTPEMKQLRALKAKLSWAMSGIERRQPTEEYIAGIPYSGPPCARNWNDAQKAYVMNHPSHTDKEISVVIGRSWTSVKGMRRTLGISTATKVWTESEEQQLLAVYPKTRTVRELAHLFGCSRHTISEKAAQMGLTSKSKS